MQAIGLPQREMGDQSGRDKHQQQGQEAQEEGDACGNGWSSRQMPWGVPARQAKDEQGGNTKPAVGVPASLR